ncbi:hypothetical protein KUCAC02_016070 [Chaenocephalus aceratus]|uniref:Uncharacterized protein n=1 Tax=Chaenocephalus aceratus TaxID=36190 RepID=A0ACB9Y1G6_CHAAC|nr:hypothetical protein KUCAC02_016070 [Chaenocephalus aceratus]
MAAYRVRGGNSVVGCGGRSRGATAGRWLTACFFPSGIDSSEPMVLEQYVAVANYERQENSEISHQGRRDGGRDREERKWSFGVLCPSFQSVATVTDVRWWFVSTAEEQGWVPATYLDSQNVTRDDLDLGTSRTGEEEKYLTIQPHASQGKDEVSFEKGVTVEVIQKNLEGWWYIRYLGKEGWALPPTCKRRSPSAEGHPDGGGGSTTPERHISKSEISLPMPYNSEINAETGRRLSAGRDNQQPLVEIGSPNLRQKPPPRREPNLGLQLPKPPAPPAVEAEYYTIADFQSSISDGISFRGGQKADVIEKNPGGWWYVQIGEKEGWAPCSYIDKRKKPNLSRRTSTLTRPKVPPPAPPVKKQEPEEAPPPASSAAKVSEPVSRPVYEEPEYDIPAVGCEGESDTDSLKDERALDVKISSVVSDKYRSSPPSCKASPPVCKASPVFTRRRTSFRSVEEVSKEECIYENDFRPSSGAERTSVKGSSEPSSPRSYRSSTVPRKLSDPRL